MNLVFEISGSHGGKYEFIVLMSEAVRTPETSVYSNDATRRYSSSSYLVFFVALTLRCQL
jgi:hypothetical protein